jgi:hypothetical protein
MTPAAGPVAEKSRSMVAAAGSGNASNVTPFHPGELHGVLGLRSELTAGHPAVLDSVADTHPLFETVFPLLAA